MRFRLIFLICLAAFQGISLASHAQIDTVWGTTSNGGPGGASGGSIFYTFPEGGPIQSVHVFNYYNEGTGAGSLTVYNGILYGVLVGGGPTGNGGLFSYNQTTGVFTLLYSFDFFTGGANPSGKLAVDSTTGILYGTASQGGANSVGTIFSYNTKTHTFADVYDMAAQTGQSPLGSLTWYKGKLYGMAAGGANVNGVIFSFDPATNTYTDLYDASDLDPGYNGNDGSLVVYNNLLYGVGQYAGVNGVGLIFSFDPATNTYQDRFDFDDFHGDYPVGITLFKGALYGVTSGGGLVDQVGELFSFDPVADQVTPLYLFSNEGTSGYYPQSNIMGTGNSLVGTTGYGGTYYSGGTLFNYDLSTGTYTDVESFSPYVVGSSPYLSTLLKTHVIGTTPQTMTFNNLSKNYGDAPFDGGAVASSGLPVIYTSDNPQVAVRSGNLIKIIGAGTANITAIQSGDPTYDSVSVTRALTVAPVPLVIKAGDTTKNQDQPNPVFRAVYTGFVNGDSAGSLTDTPTLVTTADTNSLQGTYPITASGAADPNYTITYAPGVLTVIGLLQHISMPDSVVTYGQQDTALATASSGLPVTYASSNPQVATITTDQKIHITGAGTTVLTVNQAGDADWAGTQSDFLFTVNQAILTITINNATSVYLQPYPPFTVTYSGFVYGEDTSLVTTKPVLTTTAAPGAYPGVYIINGGGAVLTPDNYTLSYVSGTLNITPVGGDKENSLQTFFSSPTSLQVNVYAMAVQNGVIQLFDVTGRPLLNNAVTLNQGFNQFTLPVTDLPAGVYIVRVVGDNMKLSTKISKQ